MRGRSTVRARLTGKRDLVWECSAWLADARPADNFLAASLNFSYPLLRRLLAQAAADDHAVGNVQSALSLRQ